MSRSASARRSPQGTSGEGTGVTWERRRARLVLPALLVVAVLSTVVLGFVSPIRQLLAQERRISETRQQAERLDAKNVRLNERIDQLQRDSVVKQIAREELGLVMPGEEAYVLVPRPAAAAPDAAPPTTKAAALPVAPTTISPPSTQPSGTSGSGAPVTTPEPGMSKFTDLDPGSG